MTIIKKNFRIEYSNLDGDCYYCDMRPNCTQTYSECRAYNKNLWKKVDKQLNGIRKKIFEQINKNN